MNKRTDIIWFFPKGKLKKIVGSSATFSSVLVAIGKEPPFTYDIDRLKKRLDEEEIDYSHIPLSTDKHGRSPPHKKSLKEILVKGSSYGRGHLKRRLLKNGLLKNECSICGQKPFWNGKPLVLILDHKNGIRDDNRIKNLRMVCGHCDSQLPTFAGRNVKRNQKALGSIPRGATKKYIAG